jgi:hypothetical protein
MKRSARNFSVLTLLVFTLVLAMQTAAAAPDLPNPVLTFMGSEVVEVSGKQMTRYYFDVDNKSSYPEELFAAASELPPCGANTKSARTWVDVYQMNGKRLNGFCAFGKPSDLTKLWFEIESDVVPPSWIYIELVDRKTGTKYKSNLAETTL